MRIELLEDGRFAVDRQTAETIMFAMAQLARRGRGGLTTAEADVFHDLASALKPKDTTDETA